MRPHALDFIPPEDVEVFWRVREAVRLLPDTLDLGKDDEGTDVELSCHILARAVSNVFPSLRCVDGHFLHGYKHSWILTPSENIIDVYPVGGASGPELKDGKHPSPAFQLYVRFDPKNCHRTYGDLFKKRWFIRAVGITTKALRRASKSLTVEEIEGLIEGEYERQLREMDPLFMGMGVH